MDDAGSLLDEPTEREESAAQAFARLDGRIAMMMRAVEHLAAERASIDIPDYGPTLVQISERLAAVAQGLGVVAAKPALQMTPEALAGRMETAALKARAADRETLVEARKAHQEAAKSIGVIVGIAKAKANERRRLLWTGSSGLIAGCLLWSFLPGALLRAMPAAWAMPEKMAAHIVGEPDLWEAGSRMIRADNPHAWRAIADAATLLRDNQGSIAACQQSAHRAKKPVRCEIEIAP